MSDNAVVCFNRLWKGGVLSPRRLSIDVTRATGGGGPQILHAPTSGSDLNIYVDCQYCAENPNHSFIAVAYFPDVGFSSPCKGYFPPA